MRVDFGVGRVPGGGGVLVGVWMGVNLGWWAGGVVRVDVCVCVCGWGVKWGGVGVDVVDGWGEEVGVGWVGGCACLCGWVGCVVG